ncbi:Aste57867_20416 [Aphanomyces stellatus]|uniref:Aste57867_20416 protein n=1 Tax=Aphanomyces stellatus TaxID=120398 RepID=A0A485LGX6_9STRA|nr:hypothetical protein As57867_020350 [Aphanomyces stellatus]VFT97102.1 Aste57867_20416 [Aphanomyces stellatus]
MGSLVPCRRFKQFSTPLQTKTSRLAKRYVNEGVCMVIQESKPWLDAFVHFLPGSHVKMKAVVNFVASCLMITCGTHAADGGTYCGEGGVSSPNLRSASTPTTAPPTTYIPTTYVPITTAAPPSNKNAQTIPEGTAVRCIGGNADFVWRYTNGQICFYPSGGIAQSWDLNWWAPRLIDCSGIPNGPDMKMKPMTTIAPSSANKLAVPDNSSVRCLYGNQDFVWFYTGNTLRFFPSGAIAASWDPNWWQPKLVDCNGIVHGPDMAMKP